MLIEKRQRLLISSWKMRIFVTTGLATIWRIILLRKQRLFKIFHLIKKVEAFADTALNAVKEKANDIFAATKLTWLEEINKYENKTGEYFQFKKNAIENIRVENIRKSKLKSLGKEKMHTAAKFQMRRNVVPKLDLYQVAYVEFV